MEIATMTKSTSARTGQAKTAPDKLAKTGRKPGVALTESELG
jgi:hypothetical protein